MILFIFDCTVKSDTLNLVDISMSNCKQCDYSLIPIPFLDVMVYNLPYFGSIGLVDHLK